jgi:hypothetical protein
MTVVSQRLDSQHSCAERDGIAVGILMADPVFESWPTHQLL